MSSTTIDDVVQQASHVIRNLEDAKKMIEHWLNTGGPAVSEPIIVALVPKDYVKKEPQQQDTTDDANTRVIDGNNDDSADSTPFNVSTTSQMDQASSSNQQRQQDNDAPEPSFVNGDVIDLSNDKDEGMSEEAKKRKQNLLHTIKQLERLGLKHMEFNTGLRLREKGRRFRFSMDIIEFDLSIGENPHLCIILELNDTRHTPDPVSSRESFLSYITDALKLKEGDIRFCRKYGLMPVLKEYHILDHLVYVNQENKKRCLGKLLTNDVCTGKKPLRFSKSWISHVDPCALPATNKRKYLSDEFLQDQCDKASVPSKNGKNPMTANAQHNNGTDNSNPLSLDPWWVHEDRKYQQTAKRLRLDPSFVCEYF